MLMAESTPNAARRIRPGARQQRHRSPATAGGRSLRAYFALLRVSARADDFVESTGRRAG